MHYTYWLKDFTSFFLVPSAACRVSPNFVDLSNYRETAKGPNRIKMDAEITRNHIRNIGKARAEKMGNVKLEVRCAKMRKV